MMLPYTTTSLCKTCYRHLPATVYEQDGKVYVDKECKEHGKSTQLVMGDVNFYNSLTKTYSEEYWWNIILLEVTDRCNLTCPHCYHLPDNKMKDRSIESIISQVRKLPAECPNIMLAGAEPTMRKDIVELIKAIKAEGKEVHILTNGVKLADSEFVRQLAECGTLSVAIGLNHPDYQGPKVHTKQLQGIINCYQHKLPITYIGYTIESYDQMDYVLDEIQSLSKVCRQIRIRCGSDIGRAPEEPFVTLSDNYQQLVDKANKLGYNVERIGGDDNIYHVMVKVGDAIVRLIQWPDVSNIVLEELRTGPWCQFYEGPVTNFVHQVIMRDALKNKKQPMLDNCPEQYHYDARTELFN